MPNDLFRCEMNAYMCEGLKHVLIGRHGRDDGAGGTKRGDRILSIIMCGS